MPIFCCAPDPSMMHPSAYYYRRAPRCHTPCMMFNPFALMMFVFVAPALFRFAFFLLAHVASFVLFFGATAYVASSIASSVDASCSEYERAPEPSKCTTAANHRCAARAFFAKTKENAKKACEGENEVNGQKRSSTTAPNVPSRRRFDLSSARLVMTDDGARVTVSAPGVQPADLEVNVLEHTLHVTGETTINGDVFCVDRKIPAPRGVELDTAKATHENGELVVTMTRKAGKRIPVNTDAPVDKRAPEAAEVQAEAQPAAADSDEWEPLAKDDE